MIQAVCVAKLIAYLTTFFAMKDPDYTMKLMSPYGSLVVKGDMKKNVWMVKGKNIFFSTRNRFPTISFTGMR